MCFKDRPSVCLRGSWERQADNKVTVSPPLETKNCIEHFSSLNFNKTSSSKQGEITVWCKKAEALTNWKKTTMFASLGPDNDVGGLKIFPTPLEVEFRLNFPFLYSHSAMLMLCLASGIKHIWLESGEHHQWNKSPTCCPQMSVCSHQKIFSLMSQRRQKKIWEFWPFPWKKLKLMNPLSK